jgi:hypothetical protein
MSDEHTDLHGPSEASSPEVEETPKEPQKKAVPARGQMTEKKTRNLAAAREAKAAKRLNQYPKDKRDAAEERYEQRVREEAEKRAKDLAKELLEKEKLEKELSEFREWKAAQTKEEPMGKPAAPKKNKKNNEPPAKKAPPTKAKRAPKQRELSEDGDQEPYISTPLNRRQWAPAYDPLAGVLD